jgi:hypothetical protein
MPGPLRGNGFSRGWFRAATLKKAAIRNETIIHFQLTLFTE